MNKNEYETEHEADMAWKKGIVKTTKKFCPMFRSCQQCIGAECMSWSPGRVYQMRDKNWRVYHASCNCSLVTGYLEADINVSN